MAERILFSLLLLTLGFVSYRWFTRYHVQRAAANTTSDPILTTLKSGIPAIVYFTTPTCIPCRTQQQPTLVRLQEEMGEKIQIVRIDATQDPDAADRWGVFSAPTTFILDTSGHPREVNHGVADIHKLKRQLERIYVP